MLTKLFAVTAVCIAITSIWGAYTQSAALQLRQEQQANYWPRRGTRLYGGYRRGRWVPIPVRSTAGSFRGGGPGAGK